MVELLIFSIRHKLSWKMYHSKVLVDSTLRWRKARFESKRWNACTSPWSNATHISILLFLPAKLQKQGAPLIRCAPPPNRDRKWKTQFWTKSEIAAGRWTWRTSHYLFYCAREPAWEGVGGFLWCRDTRGDNAPAHNTLFLSLTL